MPSLIVFHPKKVQSLARIWRGTIILIIILLLTGILKQVSVKMILVIIGLFLVVFSRFKYGVKVTIDLNNKHLLYDYMTAFGNISSITFDLTAVEVIYKYTKYYSATYGWELKIHNKNLRKRIRLSETNFNKTQLDEIKALVDNCIT